MSFISRPIVAKLFNVSGSVSKIVADFHSALPALNYISRNTDCKKLFGQSIYNGNNWTSKFCDEYKKLDSFGKIFTRGKRTLTEQLRAHKTIVEKLKLPEPPKRPLPSMALYFSDIKNDPDVTGKTISALVSEKWNTLEKSQKEKYSDLYKQKFAVYKEQVAKYDSQLSEEQKQKIKLLLMEELKEKLDRESTKFQREISLKNRKEAKSLGKPTHPGNAMICFLKDEMQKHNKEEKFSVEMTAHKWKSLSDEARSKYSEIYADKNVAYKEQLEVWEKKMLSEGKDHLVRASTLRKASSTDD